MITRWTTLQAVLPDLAMTIRSTGFSEADVMEFAFKAMEKIGSIEQFDMDIKPITVTDYKACLPKDLHQVVLMSYKEDTVASTEEELDNIRREIGLDNENYYAGFSGDGWFISDYRPLRLASSPFAKSVHCTDCINLHIVSEHTYTISPDKCVTTSFKDGTICVAYTKYAKDSDGNYLVPDDADYIDAIRTYVLMRLWEFRMNTKEEGAQNLFAFYASRWDHMNRKVSGMLKTPSLDTLENIRQMINRLVPHERNYYRGFSHLSEEETNW